MKKGQMTLFAILGLLLLLGILLYAGSVYVLKEKPSEIAKKEVVVTAEDQPIKAFVDSCVTQTAKLSLFFFGFVGGDIEPSMYDSFFSYDARYKIPYLYNEEKTQYATPELVEKTLGRYMDTKLKKCTGTFSEFTSVRITDSAPKSKVQLLDNEVIFNVDYPILIEREGKKSALKEFSARIPSRLKEMTQISNYIVEQKQKDPMLIHWDYLTEVTNKNFNATVYTEINATIVYRIVDEKNELLGEPYLFQFAVRI